MASNHTLRTPVPSDASEGRPDAGNVTVRRLRLLPIFVVVAAAFAGAGALLLAGHHQSPVNHAALPSFVRKALGPRRPSAQLTTHSTKGTTATVLGSGFEVSSPTGTLRITQTDDAAPWRRFANGAARPRSYGREAIVLGGSSGDGEQYAVVDRHLGARTWTWRLDAGKLTATLRPDGSVLVSPDHVVAGFRILPLAIYDAGGRDITPAGLGWGVERKHGSWWLTLSLDDKKLPLPYVVDPSAESFRASQNANTGAAGNTAITITKPVGLAVNDLMIAAITVRGGTSVAVCAPSVTGSWTSIRGDDSTTNLHQEVFYKVAVAADVAAANYAFTFGTSAGCATTSSQQAAGGIAAFVGVNNTAPIDANGGQANASSTTVTAPSINNATIGNFLVGAFGSANGAANFWTAPAGFTERWDAASTNATVTNRATSELATFPTTATGATGAQSATGTAAAVNIGQLITLALDTINPTQAVSINSVGAGHAFQSGNTIYYNGSAAGNFQLKDTVTDGESGPASAQYPVLGGTTTNWTHVTQTIVAPAGGPYVSTNNFAWLVGTSSSPTEGVIGSDNATNSTTTTLTFTNDITAPTAAITSPSASGYNAAGWPGSIAGTSADAGSGVAGVKVSIADSVTGKCWNGANFTTVACPNFIAAVGTTSWSFSLAAAAMTTLHNYTATVQTTDNVSNVNNAAATLTWTYDTSAPASAALTSNGNYNTAGWPSAVSGTVSDSGTGSDGISAVNVSIQDSVSGKCWNGTDFVTASCPNYVAVTSGGTAAGAANANWSYTLASSALTDGHTYTVQVQATDAATNTNTSGNLAAGTFTFDTQAPSSANLTSNGNYNTAGWPGSVTGTVNDAATGSHGISSVNVSIQDSVSGLCWNGTNFTTAPCPNYVAVTSGGSAAGAANASWSYTLASGALTDGHTYTVQVQATDATTSGNTTGDLSAGTFTFDTAAPATAALTSNGNYNTAGWPGAVTGTTNDAATGAHGISAVKVSIQDSVSGKCWNAVNFTTAACPNYIAVTSGGSSTGSNNANWSYTLAVAKLTNGHTYTVQVQSTDATTSGTVSGNLAAGTFTYDTAAPTAAALTSNGNYNTAGWPGSVTGTTNDSATGAHGISAVNVSIQDSVSGKCWNGTDFVTASCPNYVAVSSGGTAAGAANANWTYTLASSALTDGHTYTVQVQSTDATTNGNTSGNLAAGTFTYDLSAPSSAALTSNGNYNTAGWPGSVTGTVNDAATGSHGISSVNVSIQDSVSGNCWNGTDFTTVSCPNYIPVTSGGSAAGAANAAWSYTLAVAALTDGHTYTVQVQATDATTNGNTSGNLTAGTFTFDTQAPTAATLATTGNYNAAGWPGAVTGTANDAATGGHGISATKLSIADSVTGKCYNGANFTTAACPNFVAVTSGGSSAGNANANWSYTLAAGKLTTLHTYTVLVQATDASTSGNVSGSISTSSFVYDTSAPTAATLTTTGSYNSAGWPGAFTGTTNDSATGASGISAVKVSIKDSVSAKCWNGTDFVTAACPNYVSVTSGGTSTGSNNANWSYTLASSALTTLHTYTVQVQSTDATANGNVSGNLNTSTFVYDNSNPTGTITFPSAASYNAAGWTGTITGTATDSGNGGDGIAATEISIQKDGGASSCWDGTNAAGHFGAACPNWVTVTNGTVAAAGTANWTSALGSAALVNGSSYQLTLRTTDATTSGNQNASAATKTFAYDTSAPSSATLGSNGNYNTAGWPGAVTGTVSDAGTGGDGISATKVSIQDSVSGKCWNAANFTTAACPNYIAVTSGGSSAGNANANWSYTLAVGALTNGHTYTVQVQATDATTSGNVSGNLAAGTFFYDTAAPTAAALTSNGIYNAAGWPGAITGTTSDSGTGNDGISAVKVSVQDSVSGKCWNGSDFVTAACPNYISVTSGGSATGSSNANWSYTLASSALTTLHTYTVQVQSTDATTNGTTSGNLAAGTFVYDASNPTGAISFPGNGAVYNAAGWTGTVSGTATDSGNGNHGIAATEVSIQKDGSASSCWDGTNAAGHFGAACPNWVTVTNGTAAGAATANWTSTLGSAALVDVSSYQVTLRTKDATTSGNQNASAATATFTYDTTAPTVTNVTASNANGSYNAGKTIHAQVAFSEPVTVTGSPKLALNTAPAESATYVSGSGTSTLTFDYTVSAGDNVALLDYASTGALTLNGGTIRDAATNNATLTLATPGAAGSLSANKSLTIDTVVATVTSRTVSGTTLDVTYSEALDVGSPAAPSDFTVKVNGSTDTVGSVAFTTGNTIVELTLNTAVHYLDAVTVAYSGTSLQDPATNKAATYTAQAVTNLTPDAPPTTPALVAPADAVFTNTATPTLSATFADPDTLDSGKVTFEVCATSNCSSSLGTFDSTSTALAVGATGSAAVPGGFNLLTATTYYWRAENVDASAQSSASSATRSFTVDTTPPSVSVSPPSALTGTSFQYYDAGAKILWLNAAQAGSFRLEANAADAQSGIAKVNFPAVFATGSNDQTTPTSGSNYESSTYSFDGTGTPFSSPGSKTVTAYNGDTVSGPLTATDALTLDADGTGPGAFNLGGPATGAKVRDGVVVSAAPTDSGSGVASVAFFECDATTHPGCDPTNTGLFGAQIGATQTVPVAGVYSVGWSNTSLTDGDSYALAAFATDNVANGTTSAINSVVVDNSPPVLAVAAPVALTGAGAQHYDAGTKTLFLRAAGQGSFTLEASASDPHSGIATVTFPAVFGTGSNAGTNTGGSNYESSAYSFDGTGTPISSPGSKTVAATNGVTLPSPGSSTDSLTITADGTPPATNVQFPADNTDYPNLTWNPGAAADCTGAPFGGNICGTVSDGSGAGVAGVTVTIADTTFGALTYFDGAAFTSATPVPLSATVAGSNWNYPLTESTFSDGHHYRVDVHATDAVGNDEVDQLIHFTFGADITPPVTDLSLSAASHAYLTTVTPSSAYDLFYSTVNGAGGFTLHASSTDGTGTASIAFPDLTGTTGFTGSGGTQTNSAANPWNVDSPAYTFSPAATTPPGQALVTSTDAATPVANSGDDTVMFLLDNAAPTGGALTVNGSTATGGGVAVWQTNTSVSVDTRTDYTTDGVGSGVASSLLTVESATLAGGACGGYGAPTAIAGTDLSPITFATGNCYRFTLAGTDHVDNQATISVTLMIDTTPPSQPSIAFGGLSAGNTYDNGAGTLFFRPSAGGTFTVNANGSTDAESGIKAGNAGYTFSPLAGNLNGTQTVNQLAVTFDGTSNGSNAYTVHSTDNAGLDSTNGAYTVTADSTVPAGGALMVNGTAAAASPTSSYLNSGTTVTIDSRTDYTDAGSGIASSTLTVQSATFAANVCGTYGSPSTIAGTTPQTVASGNCYLFTLTGTDNVGNATSLSTVVMVDTSPPTQPAVVFSGLSAGNTFLSGSTLFFRPSPAGTFTVTATGSTDPESGIKPGNSGTTFSPLNANGGANFVPTQTGNQIAVTFDGTTTGPSVGQTVAVNNNAGLSSTPGAFTVTQDSTAPSGGSVSVAPTASSLTFAVTATGFTDGGSGMASNVVTRSDPQAPSAPGTCPGSGYSGAHVVPSTADTVPADGQCYEYTLTGTDNVGNVAAISTITLVDTTPSAGGSVGYLDGISSLSAVSVNWNSGADPQSGIAQVLLQRADATFDGVSCGTFSSFSTVATNPGASPITDSSVVAGNCYVYQLVVTNGTGLQTTYNSASIAKLVNNSPIALAPGASSGAYLAGSTLYLGGGGGTFQLQVTTTGQAGVTSATWQGKPAGSLTSAPPTDSTTNVAPFVSGTYTWSGGGISDSIDLTRNPTATVDTLTVVSDTTAPSGSISYANGFYGSLSVPISTSASDGGSGVASTQVQRAVTTLVGVTCNGAGWSGFSNVTLTGGADNTVTSGRCYQYQYVVTDKVGNSATFGSASVAQIPDVTAPTFVTGSTNAAGTLLSFDMSEALDCTATTPPTAFQVTYNGIVQPAPTGISCSGTTIVLNVPTAPNNNQTVKLQYTQPAAAGDRIRDLAVPTENVTASFGPVAVINNTTDTVAPSLVTTTVDAATLTLSFDEALAGAAPGGGAFTVDVNGHADAVTGVAISGSVVTLTLSQAVTSSDSVAVSYAVPALNALHDAAANNVAAFASAVTNQTPMPPAPPAGGGGGGGLAPALVSASPEDGSTIQAVAAISLLANESVSWTGFTVTRPDGSVAPLADRSGQSETWAFATVVPGLYVVNGTIGSGGQTLAVISHFTIWAAPAGPAGNQPPPVQKNITPGDPDTVKTSDGNVIVAWPGGAFNVPAVVQVQPRSLAGLGGLPPLAIVVDVSAFTSPGRVPIENVGDVIDIQFPNAAQDAKALTSADGKTWRDIPQLATFQLPAGQPDGWFRDSDGTIHILTRHLSLYAVTGRNAATRLTMRIAMAWRLWIRHRPFVAVRVTLSAPARVTGSFVGAQDVVIPGQVVKTPTRRAGVTLLRFPLRVTTAGLYTLDMHAEGIGQTADASTAVSFLPARPAFPAWQRPQPLRVVVVHGAGVGLAPSLRRELGAGYTVRTAGDAGLYPVLETGTPKEAVTVVVALDTVPLSSLSSLHSLLPELQIVGLTNNAALARRARAIGVAAVLPESPSVAVLGNRIEQLLYRRRP